MKTLNFEQGEDLRYRFVGLPYHVSQSFSEGNTEGFDLVAGLNNFGRNHGYALGELISRKTHNPLWFACADQPKQQQRYSDWFETIPENFEDL